MRIEKSGSLRGMLSLWLLNPVITIPPSPVKVLNQLVASPGEWFRGNLRIGDWIETALDLTINDINAGMDEIWSEIRVIPDLYDIFLSLQQYLNEKFSKIDLDIAILHINVSREISLSEQKTYERCKADLDQFTVDVAQAFNATKVEIKTSTDASILDHIKGFFWPYQNPLNIITTFGDDIIDLFKDPEEWLWNKVEKILIRFW